MFGATRTKGVSGPVTMGLLICWMSLAAGSLAPSGCNPGGGGQGQGPGHRAQVLALTPDQEVALGRQAYQEILAKSHVVREGKDVERVRQVGERIAQAAQNEPLQREINLHLQGYHFEWEFNVLRDDQINAFCLPGGKVAVYTGLLHIVEDDSQLATVMSHEVAHALAHHASERIAREQMHERALEAVNGALGRLDPQERKRLIGLLAGGAQLNSLAYDRKQESEADHIGVFLMTFAGYDPRESIVFWERMTEATKGKGHPPAILSTHPSDAQRIAQLKKWVPQAEAAKKAYDQGRIAPPK